MPVMFPIAVAERFYPDYEGQADHAVFESGIMRPIDAIKKRQCRHCQGQEGAMERTSDRNAHAECVEVEFSERHRAKLAQMQLCCKK